MPQIFFRNNSDTPPVPEVRTSTEEHHRSISLSDVTHVVVQVSDNRQKAIIEYVESEFDPQMSSPYWCFFGEIASQGLFANSKQLQLLNVLRVRTREFVAFTNVDYAKEKQRTGLAEPIMVLEVDILKPRRGEPLEIFWKPARNLIRERVRHWVVDLPHYDLSASRLECDADSNTDDAPGDNKAEEAVTRSS